MTTELLEYDHGSAMDTDLSPPAPDKTERAKAAVVNAWSIERRSPTLRRFKCLHLTGEETYEIDTESWRRFDRVLEANTTVGYLSMTRWIALSGERNPLTSIDYPVEVLKKADRRRRYAELSKLLNEWANDPSDYDEEVAPMIADALRESSPRHFPDE